MARGFQHLPRPAEIVKRIAVPEGLVLPRLQGDLDAEVPAQVPLRICEGLRLVCTGVDLYTEMLCDILRRHDMIEVTVGQENRLRLQMELLLDDFDDMRCIRCRIDDDAGTRFIIVAEVDVCLHHAGYILGNF